MSDEKITLGNELQGLRRCVHCGIAAPRMIMRFSHYSVGRVWVVYDCASCGNVVLAQSAPTASDRWAGAKVEALYPDVRGVASDLPDRAKRYLQQAIDSMIAPDGAVMLVGAAVDAMLKARGLSDGSVYDRIGQAVSNGMLTPEMAEWAHAVRLESNKPRHADEHDPHMEPADAERVVEFARMLGHILFTLPQQVADGKAKAESQRDGG